MCNNPVRQRIRLISLVMLLALIGCADDAPRVRFSQPRDGATVSSPVNVEMAAEEFTIEPAAEGVHAGAGHLHIMIDVPCLAAGQTIPKDDAHLHFGDGSTSAELALTPGQHTLCLQAADGAHVALDGLQHSIAITVSE